MRYNSGAAKAPHLIISDEQIEGIVRFYAASATCQGDKLKWTPTCQGTNCGARMFPGFLLNLSLFLSSAGGQLLVGPLRHASGMTLSPAGSGDAAQWAAPITDRRGSGDQALNGAHWAPAPPKGGGETWLPLWGSWHGAAVTERVSCQPHRPLPWLSPLRARAPRSLISF